MFYMNEWVNESLWWIQQHLQVKLSFGCFQMFLHVEELFPLLLKTLSDPSDEVTLTTISMISSQLRVINWPDANKPGSDD